MRRRIRLAAWMFALLAAPAWPQALDVAWVTESVHGYRFAFAVESVLDSSVPGDPRHAAVMDHRIVVSIRGADSRRPVQAYAVSLDIAEQGYKGATLPMQTVKSAEVGIYEARVRMQKGLPHRILVHATPVAGGRTLEAQFQYRHHH